MWRMNRGLAAVVAFLMSLLGVGAVATPLQDGPRPSVIIRSNPGQLILLKFSPRTFERLLNSCVLSDGQRQYADESFTQYQHKIDVLAGKLLDRFDLEALDTAMALQHEAHSEGQLPDSAVMIKTMRMIERIERSGRAEADLLRQMLLDDIASILAESQLPDFHIARKAATHELVFKLPLEGMKAQDLRRHPDLCAVYDAFIEDARLKDLTSDIPPEAIERITTILENWETLVCADAQTQFYRNQDAAQTFRRALATNDPDKVSRTWRRYCQQLLRVYTPTSEAISLIGAALLEHRGPRVHYEWLRFAFEEYYPESYGKERVPLVFDRFLESFSLTAEQLNVIEDVYEQFLAVRESLLSKLRHERRARFRESWLYLGSPDIDAIQNRRVLLAAATMKRFTAVLTDEQRRDLDAFLNTLHTIDGHVPIDLPPEPDSQTESYATPTRKGDFH